MKNTKSRESKKLEVRIVERRLADVSVEHGHGSKSGQSNSCGRSGCQNSKAYPSEDK